MPRPDTWSDRARPGKLQHHSARGNMPRNAGDFTRGSQLITHEFMMWFASAKMPLLVWFFTFCVALSIVLALLLLTIVAAAGCGSKHAGSSKRVRVAAAAPVRAPSIGCPASASSPW